MANEQLSLFGSEEDFPLSLYSFYRHEKRAIEELIEVINQVVLSNDLKQRIAYDKLVNALHRLPYQVHGIEITLSISFKTEDDRYTCMMEYCSDWINFHAGGAIYDKLVGTDFYTDMDLYIYPGGEPADRDYNELEIWVDKFQTLYGMDASFEVQDFSGENNFSPPVSGLYSRWEDCPVHQLDEKI